MSDDPSVLILARLADASIRWAALIALLAAWLAIRPPRRAATRHLLASAVLAAGPALLLLPYRGEVAIPWPSPAAEAPRPVATKAVAPAPSPEPTPATEVLQFDPDPAPTTAATPPRPIDWRRLGARAAVAAWGVGVLAMLARLALGARTLARWTREATGPTAGDRALLASCLEAIPTSRPVRIARHPALASPAVVGGPRPTVLVPDAWDAWPPAHRRAALLHELAHVRRYDDASKLAGELARALWWFHPLAGPLLARVDRERELLCDEAAVAEGEDPKGLARLLLELGRPGPGRRAPSASLPFLDRRTTAARIERLLEDDMSRTLSRPSLARTWLLGPLAVAAALGLGGLRVRTVSAEPPAAATPPPPEARPAAPEGLVVDADGRPVAGAKVTAWPIREGAARVPDATTDDQGRFRLDAPADARVSHVYIWKDGFLPAWEAWPGPGTPPGRSDDIVTSLQESPINRLGPAPPPPARPGPSADVPEARKARTMRLDRAEPFSAVLVDPAGRPIAGAKVRLAGLAAITPLTDDREVRRVGLPSKAFGDDFPIPSLAATTAEDGSFTLPHAAADKTTAVRLDVETADGRALVVAPDEGPQRGYAFVSPRERKTIRMVPAAKLSGRVVSRVPGVDLTGLSLFAAFEGWTPHPILVVDGRTAGLDAEGRFTIDAIDPARLELIVSGPGRDRDWTFRRPIRVDLKPGQSAEATVELIPGVEVEGRVIARQTGRPAPGVPVFLFSPPLGHPGETVRAETDANGDFRFRRPPGFIRLQFADSGTGFITPRDGPSLQAAIVPEGVERFELPPFQVEAVVAARVRVLDADRTPVPGATVSLRSYPRNAQLDSSGVTDADGLLPRDFRSGAVVVGERARLHVTPPGGEMQKVDVAPAADGLIEVVLPDYRLAKADAARVLRGIVVDPDGRPLAGASLAIEAAGPNAGPDPARWSLASDADGRFAWPIPDGTGQVRLAASMPGLAPFKTALDPGWILASGVDFRVRLAKLGTFGGVLVDGDGKPLPGARVRIDGMLSSTPPARPRDDGPATIQFAISISTQPRDADGAPIAATTAADGSFVFPAEFPADPCELRLEAFDAEGRRLSIRPPAPPAGPDAATRFVRLGAIEFRPGVRAPLTAVPTARIEGRVVSQIPGLDLAALTARIATEPFKAPQTTPVDRDGRFAFDGLGETPIEVTLDGPGVDASWTYAAARLKAPEPGATVAATIEATPGVEVRGRVVARGSGVPAEGIEVEARPRSSPRSNPVRARVDAEGRYTLRLPQGATLVAVSHPCERFTGLASKPQFRRAADAFVAPVDTAPSGAFVVALNHTASAVEFAVPAGASAFEAPALEVAPAVTLRGRLRTEEGRPIAGVLVTAMSDRPYRSPAGWDDVAAVRTDEEGRFRFQPGPATVELGTPAHLGVLRPGGRGGEPVEAVPDGDGFVDVVLPAKPAARPTSGAGGVLDGFVEGESPRAPAR